MLFLATILPLLLVVKAAPALKKDELVNRAAVVVTKTVRMTAPVRTKVVTVTRQRAKPSLAANEAEGPAAPRVITAADVAPVNIALEAPGNPKEEPKANEAAPPAPAPGSPPPPSPPANNWAVGLGMDKSSNADVGSFGRRLGWYYSWNTGGLQGKEGLEFVPMIWGRGSIHELDGGIPAGTKNILSFNEPNEAAEAAIGGSGILAGEAAQLHKQWTSKVPQGIRIGSPGISNGDDGIQWLHDFNAACGAEGCRQDFINYHFYGTDAGKLIEHTKRLRNEFPGKPLWLTEVACYTFPATACSDEDSRKFMKTAIDWIRSDEGKSIVERWAWFGAFRGAKQGSNPLIDAESGAANDLGHYYANL